MKICVVGDLHWSEFSSGLRKQGEFFSERLEGLIKTVNWCEEQSKIHNCGKMVYLGDFFDKPLCNDRELTAIKSIKWNDDINHVFIVGNHEYSFNSFWYNTTKILEKDNFYICNSPTEEKTEGAQLLFLPYISDEYRKSLTEYFKFEPNLKHIVFSHNDLKGIFYGKFKSVSGFDVEEINRDCDLYINGHLHNGTWINNKILNLGNITGQNFNEDALTHKHRIGIIDTETLEIEFIENPYAFNFIQVDITKDEDVDNFIVPVNNCVVNFRCTNHLLSKLKDKIKTLDLISSRITTVKEKGVTTSSEVTLEVIDVTKKFSEFMTDRLGTSDIVKEEIMEVIK